MDNQVQAERRLESLESIQSLRQLRYEWNNRTDDALGSHDWRSRSKNPSVSMEATEWLAAQVTEDFEISSNIFETGTGPSGLRTFLKARQGTCDFSFHLISGDHITLDSASEDAAPSIGTGLWYSLGMMTVLGEALWVASSWVERYARVDDDWMVTSMAGDYKFVCRYADGWGGVRFVEEDLLRLVY